MRVESRGRVVSGGGIPSSRSKAFSKKKKQRRQKRSDSMAGVVQRLFETCREAFADARAGFIPSPVDIHRLRAILDNMTAADVGLTENMPYFRNIDSRGAPPIRYLHIYECDKFSIGIFCLPSSGVIPLHNHPGMTVFSKILFGSMHIKSYDWVDVPREANGNHPNFQMPGARLARIKTDAIFTAPCRTSILYPEEGGNIHCFTAVTPCAVLDVIGPPYSDYEGRHCTYYNELFPGAGDILLPAEVEGHAWLEETEKADDFVVMGATYRGPRIMEH
ncbi:plant cysteine oxidase 2-like [Typha angustifolia]|uniref:plant cysteine oxidase 2-like n=1 Tax=Typha angustifolia TaxID=59011 RepID=UPI003C2F21C4